MIKKTIIVLMLLTIVFFGFASDKNKDYSTYIEIYNGYPFSLTSVTAEFGNNLLSYSISSGWYGEVEYSGPEESVYFRCEWSDGAYTTFTLTADYNYTMDINADGSYSVY